MTEVPRVHVHAVDLQGETPVALYDSASRFELGIDFSQSPEQITSALTDVFQEAVDTSRWQRRGPCGHTECEDRPEEGAAAHPDDDPS